MPTPADYLNISEVVDVLEDIGIDYWVSHGTLLGFAREGKILEWDNDIDIAVEGPEAITHWKMLFGALMDKGFQVDYRFNYILCSRFNQVDLPISLELNWETDSRFLYVGGAWGTRNPGLIAYFVERLFFRVIISLLETVPNAYHGKNPVRKILFHVSKYLSSPLFSPVFLGWFSTLAFHKKYRSTYHLDSKLIKPTSEVTLQGNLRIRFPSRASEVLKAIYGESWVIPDPYFDKSMSYSKAPRDNLI
jgi:hypothetical protein